eukprot:jgi/Bigna1/143193/aug1.76_g17901
MISIAWLRNINLSVPKAHISLIAQTQATRDFPADLFTRHCPPFDSHISHVNQNRHSLALSRSRLRLRAAAEEGFSSNSRNTDANSTEITGRRAMKSVVTKWGLRAGLAVAAFYVVQAISLYRDADSALDLGGRGGGIPGGRWGTMQAEMPMPSDADLAFPRNGTLNEEEAYYFMAWGDNLRKNQSKREIIDLLTSLGFDRDQLKRMPKDFLVNIYLEHTLKEIRKRKMANISVNAIEMTPVGAEGKLQRSSSKVQASAPQNSDEADGQNMEWNDPAALQYGIVPYNPKNYSNDEMYRMAKKILGRDMPSRKEFDEIIQEKDDPYFKPATSSDLGVEAAEHIFSEYWEVAKKSSSNVTEDPGITSEGYLS